MSHELSNDPILRDVGEVEGYKVLGPCVLTSKIGQGGMGAVYRGHHVKLEIDVAVKCLLPALLTLDGDLVTRFHREAQLAARVTHQNLVRVYDVGEQGDLHYLIMEYVTGESLRQRVDRAGACSPADAVTIIRQAAEGLAAAHAEEIVHRDIKPDNILISVKGVVKVADLGLGRIGHGPRDLTMSRVPMGTPTYMPPEQWKAIGSVGPEGDVWALGATLYYLLAGEGAFSGASMQDVQRQICEGPFPHDRLVDLPDGIRDVLCRSTQHEPENRYASARELADALEDVASRHGFGGEIAKVVHPTLFETSTAVMDTGGLPPRSVIERIREEATPSRGVRSSPVPTGPTVALPSGRSRALVWGGSVALVVVGVAAFFAFDWIRDQFALPKRTPGMETTERVASPRLPEAPPGFRYHEQNQQTLHEFVHESSGIVMVSIPGGYFEMGSPDDDEDAVDDEKPRHWVRLSPFLIAKYEVSQAEWRRVMGPWDESHPFPIREGDPDSGDENPVFNVSWYDCQEFCRRTGLQFPSEAQWEYACRGRRSRRFAFGPTLGALQANFIDSGESGFVPVRAPPPNPFGLHNVHGNVAEWCRDIYHPDCYEKAKGEPVDPVCEKGDQDFRVRRGGHFQSTMEQCRCASRDNDEPDAMLRAVGFRPVFELKESE